VFQPLRLLSTAYISPAQKNMFVVTDSVSAWEFPLHELLRTLLKITSTATNVLPNTPSLMGNEPTILHTMRTSSFFWETTLHQDDASRRVYASMADARSRAILEELEGAIG
jgi:hypothetical protein